MYCYKKILAGMVLMASLALTALITPQAQATYTPTSQETAIRVGFGGGFYGYPGYYRGYRGYRGYGDGFYRGGYGGYNYGYPRYYRNYYRYGYPNYYYYGNPYNYYYGSPGFYFRIG
jgi:hypothetical protein